MNNEKTEKLTGLSCPPASSLPDLPQLPKRLNELYQVLTNDNKRLFMRVFRWLWVYLNGKRVNLSSSYWAINLVRASSSLPIADLSLLSYIYQVSGKGSNIVRSDAVYKADILPGYNIKTFPVILHRLKRLGYLARFTSDPSAPYLSRSYDRHPVFIKMTAKGVKFIEDLNREVNNIMMRQSLADLTGKQ